MLLPLLLPRLFYLDFLVCKMGITINIASDGYETKKFVFMQNTQNNSWHLGSASKGAVITFLLS